MTRRKVIVQALLAARPRLGSRLGRAGLRSFAQDHGGAAQRTHPPIHFADWSALESAPDPAEAKRRESELRDIAGIVNRLDFQEREKNRQNRSGDAFFRKLNSTEKNLFIDLTVMESMNRFMEALDSMPPAQRKKFVEQGLSEIEDGRTAEEMARAKELGADLLEKISQEGMRAYFEKSTTQTKLDLAPLMEAVNETMQGLRGSEFGPRHQQ